MIDLIDADVIIRACAEYYAMDICPGFWTWLERALNDGSVVMLPEVRAEITPRDDRLEEWLRTNAVISVPPTMMPMDEAYRRVNAAVGTLECTQYSVQRFRAGADFHLVAYAVAGDHRIVSLETKEDPTKSARRLKIPDIADALGVTCVRPFKMLADHGARFELLDD